MKHKENVIGRVFDVSNGSKNTINISYAYSGGHFVARSMASSAKVAEIDAPGVVLRGPDYLKFDVICVNLPIWVGDIVTMAPDSTVAIELLVGARVGVKRGGTIKIVSADEAVVLDAGQWREIVLNSGGLYAKFHQQEKPLTIQTRAGAMSIKG